MRPSQRVSQTSMTGKLVRSEPIDGPIEVAAEEWCDDWKRGGVVWEEARHSARWTQTLALLWFDDDRVPSSAAEEGEDEELAFQPLDGVLPWPGKHRRRR